MTTRLKPANIVLAFIFAISAATAYGGNVKQDAKAIEVLICW